MSNLYTIMIETLKTLFTRDLNKLKTEILSYQNEARIWHHEKNIANSAGNLCLHLIGNVNAYIGVGLAKTNYIRQRDLEFSNKNIPREQLEKMIDDTISVVETGLENLSANDLENPFPILVWDEPSQTDFTLFHLLSHLNYHLGQINYHRRLLDE